MPVEIVPVTPDDPREERIRPAVRALREGGIVVVPTETFYGLAVECFNEDAVRAVNRLKGKPDRSPVLLLMADVSQIHQVAADLPEQFELLASTFWPGPLTLVVPASDRVPREVTGGRATVGVRVPGLTLPRRLAERLGRPISGVSANLHGQPPLRNAADVLGAFPEGVDVILDAGPTAGGLPSTVVDLAGDRPTVLRAGAVPASALRPFLRDLQEPAPRR